MKKLPWSSMVTGAAMNFFCGVCPATLSTTATQITATIMLRRFMHSSLVQ